MRKLLLFPVLAALYVLGCSGDSGMPCGSCGDDSKCGNEWYNSFKQFCYVGLVYDKCGGMTFAADKQGCCGSMIYNLSSSFCSCYSVERASSFSDEFASSYCYATIYNKCGGTIEFTPRTERCCGSSKYTFATQFCSDNSVYDKCDGNTYNPPNQRCQNNVIEYKCGSDYYNSSTRFCREDKVYDKCDGSTYDPSNQRCKNNVVESKCGTGSDYYNSSTQFCREDKVYDKCNGDTYNPSNQRCESDVVKDKCGTGNDYYIPSTQFCTDNKVYNRCNGQSYIPISQRCGTGNVIETKCGSDWYNLAAYTRYCKNGTTLTQYGSFEYAGQTYRTVTIGTQTWMAQNLNYNATNSKCFGDNTGRDSLGNCAKYGRLYNWSTAMVIDAKYNSEYWGGSDVKHRGVCPTGWHLPSNAEWTTLTDFVGGSSTAGTKLKATSGWNDYNGSGNGTDEFGFSALPGGYGYSGGYFNYAGNYGYWWSASENNSNSAYYRNVYYSIEDVYYYGNDKSRLYSVRCLQD